MLGNYAKEKSKIIENGIGDEQRCVKGIHPSPLSANSIQKRTDGSIGGFFNSGIFKKVEELVGKPIDWQN